MTRVYPNTLVCAIVLGVYLITVIGQTDSSLTLPVGIALAIQAGVVQREVSALLDLAFPTGPFARDR